VSRTIRVENDGFHSDPSYLQRVRIVTQAPMRITLAGGGTDVMWYSREKGGAWISAAIDMSVQTSLSQTEDPKFIKVTHGREAYMGYNWRDIENPYILNCLDIANVRSGVELSTQADASAGSGLGGSAALEVSMLLALHTYMGNFVPRSVLAEQACEIEIDRLKRPVGPQDQLVAAYGGINSYILDTNGRVTVESLGLSRDTIRTLESNLLFFRTGIHRDAGNVLADQKKKVSGGGSESIEVISALDEIKELGYRARAFLETGDVDSFGKTLHEHWLIKRRLSSSVTNVQIDSWYQGAIKAGALGGKIMGAGGGGWFLFYVNENKNRFAREMQDIGLIEKNVRFDWYGARVLVNQSY